MTVNIGTRHKILQIFFGRDRSLFVNFPYFQQRTGILAVATYPPGREVEQINLEFGGKVASHLVKYSHHPDGRAHFSQDGKVRTEIKTQSVPLSVASSYLFSIIIQGASAFEVAHDKKDVGHSPKRTVLNFDLQHPTPDKAIKFAGHWYGLDALRFDRANIPSIGPLITTTDPSGVMRNAFLVASPHENADHVLALNCELIPKLSDEPETLVFYGGFDPHFHDVSKPATFLAFVYPAAGGDDLKRTLGCIDFAPASPSPSRVRP